MGFDLSIYFAQVRLGDELIGTSKIKFERDSELFESIESKETNIIRTRPFEPRMKLSCHTDDGILVTNKDAYGSELNYFFSCDMNYKIINALNIKYFNLHALKFMISIPSHIPMVLYWH